MLFLNRDKILRKFGFKTDQSGIINRYLRENGGWDEHLNHTKNYILKTAENKNKKKAVVLGSGWLLDVPAEELSDIFEKVILVDIYHPRQIKHKLKNIKNIEFISTDITGLAKPIYELFKKKNVAKPNLSAVRPLHDNAFINEIKNADFIVSVNILNQLDILICDYIMKLNIYEDSEINLFRSYIQSSHIQLLANNKSALITDYEEINTDDDNSIIARKNLLYIDLLKNKEIEKWTWKFDQNKTYHHNCNTKLKVMAMRI